MSTVRGKSFGWVVPNTCWMGDDDTLVVLVSPKDHDLAILISDGYIDVAAMGSKLAAKTAAIMLGPERSLFSSLAITVAHPARSPNSAQSGQSPDRRFYFTAACSIDGRDEIAVVVSRSETHSSEFLSSDVKSAIDELVIRYRAEMAEYKAKEEERHQRGDYSLHQGPFVAAATIKAHLPHGVLFKRHLDDVDVNDRRALTALSQSRLSPSRDGEYSGYFSTLQSGGGHGVVIWRPHTAAPAYPHLRAALQSCVPGAFSVPRIPGVKKPDLSDLDGPALARIDGSNPSELLGVLSDIRIEYPDASARYVDLRNHISEVGFEAIAWYQSYHDFTESFWGIYLDASRLDEFAFGILEELRWRNVHIPHHYAAFIAFGLILHHERFHADVEAAATWLELSALKPRYLRYSTNVYGLLRNTPDWLEEALANWRSWDWMRSPDFQRAFGGFMAHHKDAIGDVVASLLDLSPSGYRDWRKGDSDSAWGDLATQLSQGRAHNSRRNKLPLGGILKGPLPFDIQWQDIPVRFVGNGIIASRLLSRHATFNVPARDELERVLKLYKHVPDPSSGKGSHIKWTGPDRRAFPVPKRDPVSQIVFRKFLSYLGIDKKEYIEIRSRL